MKVIVTNSSGDELLCWEGYAENISDALMSAFNQRQEDYAAEED